MILVRMMVYLMTQSASLGVQESTTELRDWGEKEGLSGAEGGPKKRSFNVANLHTFRITIQHGVKRVHFVVNSTSYKNAYASHLVRLQVCY